MNPVATTTDPIVPKPQSNPAGKILLVVHMQHEHKYSNNYNSVSMLLLNNINKYISSSITVYLRNITRYDSFSEEVHYYSSLL